MILFVYAHPDDESFWGVGTAARYREEGVNSVLVVATRGERGTTGDLCSIDDLPRVRENEVREAARIAGFAELVFLEYEDQKLADAPGDEVRQKLAAIIRRVRPIVVATFDPEGGNRHPDHVAISRFTSDAIAAAADARWYPEAGSPHSVQRLLWTPPVRPWEIAGSDLARARGVDFVVDTHRHWQQRADALRAHRTQRRGIDKLFLGRADLQQILSVEVWRHAWGPPLASVPADDVFAGLRTG